MMLCQVVIRSLRCLDTSGLDYPLTQHHIPEKHNTWWWKWHGYNGKNHENLSHSSQLMHKELNLWPTEYHAQSWSRHFVLRKDQTADNHLMAGKGAHVWSDCSSSRTKDSCSIKQGHMQSYVWKENTPYHLNNSSYHLHKEISHKLLPNQVSINLTFSSQTSLKK